MRTSRKASEGQYRTERVGIRELLISTARVTLLAIDRRRRDPGHFRGAPCTLAARSIWKFADLKQWNPMETILDISELSARGNEIESPKHTIGQGKYIRKIKIIVYYPFQRWYNYYCMNHGYQLLKQKWMHFSFLCNNKLHPQKNNFIAIVNDESIREQFNKLPPFLRNLFNYDQNPFTPVQRPLSIYMPGLTERQCACPIN